MKPEQHEHSSTYEVSAQTCTFCVLRRLLQPPELPAALRDGAGCRFVPAVRIGGGGGAILDCSGAGVNAGGCGFACGPAAAARGAVCVRRTGCGLAGCVGSCVGGVLGVCGDVVTTLG